VNGYESFLQKIEALSDESQKKPSLSLKEIVSILGYSSHYVSLLFLTIPFLQPIPLIGLSTPAGILIAISSLCIIFSKKLYLPKFLRNHETPAKKINKMTEFLLSISKKINRWLHPRGKFMHHHVFLRKFNGLLLLCSGILLSLPLPFPLTNTLPAYTIMVLCLGSLKEDGLFIGIGWIFFAITIAYFCTLTQLSVSLF
jgi:hypothetical protein